MLNKIRKNFSGHFSAKIRIGYDDNELFDDIIQTLESESIDSITIHGRTRAQLYKGHSNWEFIKRAVGLTKIPIIGNGDVLTIEDVEKCFDTGCHSLMLGRGALSTPWLAGIYKEFQSGQHFNDAYLDEIRKNHIKDFFLLLEENYKKRYREDTFILGRKKQLIRYLFNEFDNCEEIRGQYLRSQTLGQFNSLILKL